MGLILQKCGYIFAALVINLYICSYLGTKLGARIEQKKGIINTRFGGLGYPAIKFGKYITKQSMVNIYHLLLFVFSLLVWAILPITQNLFLIDINSNFFISILFYIIILMLLVFSSQPGYGFLFTNSFKQSVVLVSFFIPVLINFLSVIILARAINLKELVNLQYEYWNIVFQPLGFVLVFISIIVQVKILGIFRDNNFSVGSLTSICQGLPGLINRIAKYVLLFYLIIMLNIFYLGGWLSLHFVSGWIMLGIKFYLIFIAILIFEKSIPELDNYKYLVDINWKFIAPVSVFNFVFTLIFLVYRNIFNLV